MNFLISYSNSIILGKKASTYDNSSICFARKFERQKYECLSIKVVAFVSQ